MCVSHRQRLRTAWSLREPDRVPIELRIFPSAARHPEAGRVLELIEEHADNLAGMPGVDWGFLGFPSEYTEEFIEEVPGRYRRMRCTHVTSAGTFTAVTYHPEGDPDYHWERRFVSSIEDLRRLAETPRPPARWDAAMWREKADEIGDRALPTLELLHPLGFLVRNSTMEEVYTWLHDEGATVHRFLEAAGAHVAEAVKGMTAAGIGPYFTVTAHEMLLPPWMGHRLFDEFVFPYDKSVNDAVHAGGGKVRAHCHGNCMDFLEQMSAMGIDAIEPLEAPPGGDVDLAEAKRSVGDRMMLSGNIPSERFVTMSPGEVRELVREAIAAAAPGGGFSLRTTGAGGGTCACMNDDQMAHVLANCEAFLLAGLEFGCYPIRPTSRLSKE